MGAMKRNTLSVLFIIKKAKLLKNGEAPVCIRITVNKRVAEVMIKRSIPADLWNQKRNVPKEKIANRLLSHPVTLRIQQQISKIRDKNISRTMPTKICIESIR